jgi:hypothetical protein
VNPARAFISSLSRLERLPAALRQSPVDPLQEHRQLSRRQGDLSLFGRWPDKPPLFEPFASRMRTAKLRHVGASPEDVDYKARRGLDKALFQQMLTGRWIKDRRNLMITGPCDPVS